MAGLIGNDCGWPVTRSQITMGVFCVDKIARCTKDLFSPWILFQRHDGIHFKKPHVCKMFSLRPNVKSQFRLHFVLFFYANRRTIFAYLHSEKRSFHFCKKQRRALLCLWEGTSRFSLPNS